MTHHNCRPSDSLAGKSFHLHHYIRNAAAAPLAAMVLAAAATFGFAPDSALAQGFPNINRTPGELLSGPIAPEQGRTAIIAWHGERVVTVPEAPGSQNGADVDIRIVSIEDPANPQVTHLPVGATGFNAHGYFQSGTHLFIGPHCLNPSLQPCGQGEFFFSDSFVIGAAPGAGMGGSRLIRGSMEEDLGLPVGTYNRSGAQSPWGAEMWWTYGAVGGNAFLAVRRSVAEWLHDWNNNGAPTGPALEASWDHLGQTGVIGHPFIIGNILIYAADQSGSGVATYDISNPRNPVLLDVLKDENPGGYWPEIYGHYIFFPRRDGEGGIGSQAGFMVVDYQDPTNLQVVADRNLPGSNQYVTFQDEYAFMNRYKIDLRTFEPVLTLATNGVTLDASQFALPVGNLVLTGGYGTDGPGLAVWAHQATPDTRGPFVAYHIPRPDQTNYSIECPITLSIPETLKTETIVDGVSLILRPVGGSPIPTWHSFGQGKLLTVTPRALLAPNTTYEFLLTSAIQDAAGNAMEPYSFRFSTGSNVSGGNQPPAVTAITATPAVPSPNGIAPGTNVLLSWTATDPDSASLEYRIDFGDGSPRTPWISDTATSHTYAEEGHYQVTVQVRDSAGAAAARTRSLTIINAPAGTRGTASNTIVLDAAGTRVFVVNPDNDTVTALDAATRAKLWEAPVGAHPKSLALAADGTLWVVCRDGDAIDILDPATGARQQQIALPYGARPVAIAPTPDAATLYVTGEGDGTLRRFSAATRAQSGSIALGASPRAIAINGAANRAFITRFISPEHEGQVYDVSLAGSMSLTRTIRLQRDRSADGSASGRGVPNYLAGIRISPDGNWVWVVGKKDNTTRGTFFSPTNVPGADSTVRAQLMLISVSGNAEDLTRRLDIDNSDSPTAVAFSPLGDYAFITLQGNAQVAVVDVLDFMRQDSPGTVRTRWATGRAPQGIVADTAQNRLFTHDFMGRSVTFIDSAHFIEEGGLDAPSVAVSTVERERLAPSVLLGKRIFYHASDTRMSAEGYISCATCHIDGSHDGRTFDFTNRGEGFRNTTDLRGRSGIGHGRVHWSGNFDEIQDFENDIRGFFGGRGFLSDADFSATSGTLGLAKAGRNAELDALAAYVTSLGSASLPRSPHRAADGSLTAAALRGRDIFNAQNCNACHASTSDFTDRTMHNVGTLRASSGNRFGAALTSIDTPSLLGAHAAAPFFHDGSADAIEDVFAIAGGTLYQAERVQSGVNITTETVSWHPYKEWHQQGFMSIEDNGSVTFPAISSATAGAGMVELRYNVRYALGILTVSFNGTPVTTLNLPVLPNNPGWMPNEWRKVRVAVNYVAGPNTLTLSRNNGGGLVSIDDILFATPADFALANPHARSLSSTDLADLAAYILSLDGTDAAHPAPALARDAASITVDATDIASFPAGGGAHTFTYTITNNGTGPLNLGTFHLDDVAPVGSVVIVQQPAPTVLAGATTTLQIRIEAGNTAASARVRAWTDSPTSPELRWTLNATSGAPAGISGFLAY